MRRSANVTYPVLPALTLCATQNICRTRNSASGPLGQGATGAGGREADFSLPDSWRQVRVDLARDAIVHAASVQDRCAQSVAFRGVQADTVACWLASVWT